MYKHTSGLLRSCLFALLLAFTLFSCQEKSGKSELIDVEFKVPESVTVDPEGDVITFRVMFSKAPLKSDVIVLADSKNRDHECRIVELGEKSFSIAPFEGIFADSYKVSLKRGKQVKAYGTMQVIIKDNLNPGAAATVYGRVTCEGRPLADVVISDGVEVVKTDASGVYQMTSQKKFGYVFVSIPSGYEVLSDGVLPLLHQRLISDANTVERVDFNLVKSDWDQNSYTLLTFGDMHLAGGRNNDRIYFSQFCNDVNDYIESRKSEKVLALTLGDMTWDYYWYDRNYQFKEYLADVNNIKNLTIFHTIGNHDHDMNLPGDFENSVQFTRDLAPDFYSFNIGKVHYVILDDILSTSKGGGKSDRKYNELVTEEEFAWLAKDLAFVSKDYSVIVAMHATTGNLDSADNRNRLVSCFDGFSNVHFVTGHTHKFSHSTLSSTCSDHNTGAVCADWWNSANNTSGAINIGQDGGPAGYSIYNISGTDLKWQYKPTNISTDYQFRSYDRNCINLAASVVMPDAADANKLLFDKYAAGWAYASDANEVYINVWNYGPGWSIEVTENGKSLSVSKASSSLYRDPLHLYVYQIKTFKSSTSETFATSSCGHMWMVTASSPTSTLEIKVSDPFGNVYTETMTRPKQLDVETYRK